MSSQSVARTEWRNGWTIVIASMVGFSFFSVMTPAVGLFIQPLSTEFGWTRTQASMGVSISGAVVALLSPLFGMLIDRWGPRRVAMPGLVLSGLSIAAFSLANGSITQWVGLWVVYGLTSLAVKSTVWTAAVAGAFNQARGLALGYTMAGAAVAQVVAPLTLNAIIEGHGWRWAYLYLGFGWGGVAFLVNMFWLKGAGRGPGRSPSAAIVDPAAGNSLTGLTVREAWRDASLWKIAGSTFIIMTLTVAILVHQFPLLIEAGVTRAQAAQLAALSGFAGIFGKLMTGWFMDRWHARWVGGITILASSLTFILLLAPFRTSGLIVVAMVINGYAAGAKLQVCGYLTTRYAGLRNFGVIFGFMASIMALASGLGPILGGLSYDAYGNYTPLLIGGVIGCVASSLLLMRLGDYPVWEARDPLASQGVDRADEN